MILVFDKIFKIISETLFENFHYLQDCLRISFKVSTADNILDVEEFFNDKIDKVLKTCKNNKALKNLSSNNDLSEASSLPKLDKK